MFQFWHKSIIRNIFTGTCCFALSCSAVFASAVIEGIQIYPKTAIHSPERTQMLAHDIDRYENAGDLWDTLRDEFKLPHYESNPLVQQKIAWFMNHQDFLYRSISRAAPYLYFILQQVKARHLPAELVLLPIIESAYNPFAYSYRGAAGIWQMMPGTASDEGVRQNWWYDGRRDIIASTNGALNHLSYLQNFFDGNWLLAIAAYNTGEGNVLAAIRKNINLGENTDFWTLPVAQQTKDYVPQLLALAIIISHPEQYPVPFPPVRNAAYLAQVDVGTQIDLKSAASLAGLSLHELMQLNPGFNRSATEPNGPFQLILPIENVERFSDNLDLSPLARQVNFTHYRIHSGDTLAKIAHRYNTSAKLIRRMNPRIASLKPGRTIVIPLKHQNIVKTIMDSEQPVVRTTENVRATHKSTTVAKLTNALENVHTRYKMQPGDTLYMVRRGDDLNKISKHFHTSNHALIAINDLRRSGLHVGQRIVIPTHLLVQHSEKPKYELASGDTIYMVRPGDTVESIAHKFHTTPQVLRLTNLLGGDSLQEGDRLVIPTHVG